MLILRHLSVLKSAGRRLQNSLRTETSAQRCYSDSGIFASLPGLVADGRDMGTVVFPDATHKFFLTASAQVRAERRYQQLKENGINDSIPRLFTVISERDARDASRSNSPLTPATDAIVLDTSDMSLEQVIGQVRQQVGYQGL